MGPSDIPFWWAFITLAMVSSALGVFTMLSFAINQDQDAIKRRIALNLGVTLLAGLTLLVDWAVNRDHIRGLCGIGVLMAARLYYKAWKTWDRAKEKDENVQPSLH